MQRKYLDIIAAGTPDTKVSVMNELKRPLSKKGITQVLGLLEELKEKNFLKPELILCSPCLYVCQTLDLLHEVLKSVDVICKDGLYAAPDYRILEMINNLDDILSRVMIVGELPGLKHFLGYVCVPSAQNKLNAGRMVQLVFKPNESWHDFGCQHVEPIHPFKAIKPF